MTTILAVFETGARLPKERGFRAALECAAGGKRARVNIHLQPGVVLGIAQAPVEDALPTESCDGLAIDDNYVALVDGSFYYLEDLSRALGSTISRSTTSGQIVLEAFRRFGASCASVLEGDFAFVVWNRHTREVFCARDFTGRRPLFLAEWSGGLVASSSLDSIAAIPEFTPAINVGAVGADAAGLLFALDDDTCMHGVRSLRSGHIALWRAGERFRTVRVWHPQPAASTNVPFEEAAISLREILARAVSERVSPSGPTAVWMSGGRDSTAVFASGMRVIAGDRKRHLVPVSRSHPPGDSGREDEAIEAVTQFWNVAPNWVDSQTVPLFDGFRDRNRWSAEPFAQPFEGFVRSLASAGRSLGASVALDGYGGDFLFQVSRVYLADLVARGSVGPAIRQWRAMDRAHEGAAGFIQYGVQPLLPRWAKRSLAGVRSGRALRSSMQKSAPPWINRRFERAHSLSERLAALGPDAQRGHTAVDREAQFYLSHQFFARVNSRVAGFALEHGVELRSPLLDSRVVRFALSRPGEERNAGGDRKRLLRASMRGLLPDSVLASRVGKSGTLASYFAQHMRNDGLRRLTEMLPARELAALGVIDSAELTRAIEEYRARGFAYPHVEALFCTLQAETWLRSRSAVIEECEPARASVDSA
jgi:asparagine synthase (glutamine-hydrolysing)